MNTFALIEKILSGRGPLTKEEMELMDRLIDRLFDKDTELRARVGQRQGESPAVRQQSMPSGDGPAVWPLVIADMKARSALGVERYGTPLRSRNGRDALVDAYQEALDLVVYLRQAIAERDE